MLLDTAFKFDSIIDAVIVIFLVDFDEMFWVCRCDDSCVAFQ